MNKYSILFLSLIFSQHSFAGVENAITGDSDSSISGHESSVKAGIKSKLTNYYIDDNQNTTANDTLFETEWLLVKAPFDCSSWTLNGGTGNDERTCKVINAKVTKQQKTDDNSSVNLLQDLVVNYEEVEQTINQVRTPIASAPSGPTAPPIPPSAVGVEAYITAPVQAGLGESFNITWDSINAVTCSVTQQTGSATNGSGSVRLYALGNQTVSATCSDTINSKTVTATVEILPIPLELTLNAPSSVKITESLAYNWDSVGASNCTVTESGMRNSTFSAVYGTRSYSIYNTNPLSVSITCTNGIDSITKNATINISITNIGPPAGGTCYYPNHIMNLLNLRYTKYMINNYGSISSWETSGFTTYLTHKSHDRYTSINNPIKSQGFGMASQYGWRTPNNSTGHTCHYGSGRYTQYYYSNSYACEDGKLYLVEVKRTCSANQYNNRTWMGKRLMIDFNNY